MFNSDINTIQILNDAQITINAVQMLSRLDPVARALHRAHMDGTTISETVQRWHSFEKYLENEK